MVMVMGPVLIVKAALRCEICWRHREEDGDEDAIDLAPFGAAPYAVCPGCKHVVRGALMDDPNYRRRARVRQFIDTGIVWPAENMDLVPSPASARGGRPTR